MSIRNINKKILRSISTFSLIAIGIGCTAFMGHNAVNNVNSDINDSSVSMDNAIDTDMNISSDVDNNEDEIYHSFYNGDFGSCGKLEGNTVIVSIIADDESNKWEYGTDFIEYGEKEILNDLNSSTEFMVQKASEYGKDVTFTYDWSNNPDLIYNAQIDSEILNDDTPVYEIEKQWILDNINVDDLKNKYKADNIAFIFYFNTGKNNECRPGAYTNFASDSIDIEIINMYTRWDKYCIPVPFTYIHELLHLYGAPDLYYSNEYIPEEYVEYCNKIQKNDIMYSPWSSRDTPDYFTELDAYYVGLTDNSSEKELWNLGSREQKTMSK